tara:strand:+ start:197 stop:625 length:429 start_codon:yes stop_codon:yes gene_type:complete
MWDTFDGRPPWREIEPNFRVDSNHPHTTKPNKITLWHEHFTEDKISALWKEVCGYDWYIDSDIVFGLMRGWFADAVEESIGEPESEDDVRNYTFIIEGENRRVSFARYEGEGAIASSETCEETWQYAFHKGKVMYLITLSQY